MVTKKCPKCGKPYQMGVNGIVGSRDECAGITRDANNHFWLPDEKEHNYMENGTGKIFTVTREEAFRTGGRH